ncbi:DinB family protein [Chloroflexota bacterium]
MNSQRQELLVYVGQLSNEQTGQREAEKEWCPKEQLLHLTKTETLWVDWALQIRNTPDCTIIYDLSNPEGYPEALSMSLSDLLNRLTQVRRDTIEVIQGLSEDDLQQTGKHSYFGDMSVLQMLRGIYRHERMHLEQIQGIKTTFQPKPVI